MARRDTDDDAPWLAEAETHTSVSKRSLFWTIFILLALAAVAAVGLIMLLSKKNGGSTQGYMNAEQAPIIAAEIGPYKIAPVDPKGMDVEGIDGEGGDQSMYTTGLGIDQGSVIDQAGGPEEVMPRPGSEPALPPGPPQELVPEAAIQPPATMPPATLRPAAPPVAAIKPSPKPAVPKLVIPKPAAPPLVVLPPPTPKPTAAHKPGSVQLGAFSSEEKALAAWGSLAAKHGLSGKRIIPVESNGKTLFRLRAVSPDTAATCAKMKAAGDACSPVE
ncbi:hypothetical protein GCM10011529_24360 [Polymorphobacter glacialis]|uniref:SPOR domain-containing protein n=1 Tax=Sandarakinorhabdus glacialis TaxID=1614636 RepID=A0A916ZWL4_9SPHN|nr:SPOR domain-containing protein [Polymorphobacter glacialis]GGE17032.1 hypothetical protein GCM10011529_24360 [Polymorphobacter glacialis]